MTITSSTPTPPSDLVTWPPHVLLRGGKPRASALLGRALLVGGLLGGIAVAMSPAAPAAATRAVELPYEKIAKEFADAHGLAGADLTTTTYETALEKGFVRLPIGAFDARFPCAALDERAEDVRTAAAALVTAQDQYLAWLVGGTADVKGLRDDAKLVANWIKSWRAPQLAKGKSQPNADLFQVLGAPEAVTAASARLRDALAKGTALGPAREAPVVARLVFAPSRKEFTGFVYLAGLLKSDLRANFWLDSVPDWTQCFVGDDQVLALEYAAVGRQPGDYTSRMGMDEILPQQVAQLAMNSLFGAHYGERVPAVFVSGLSMNLVVDAFGMVQTRVDGDLRSRTAGKREQFVAGGLSEGGMLAKNSAETKWRENGGRDHFLGVLRTAQDEGAKLARDAKNKLAVFSIRSDKGGDKWAAIGPFFGAAGGTRSAPPAEFQGDFAEFARAYKSAFLFWLQTKAGGNEKASREKFGTLLRKLADPNLTGDFEAVFGEVYDGAKLSSADVDKDTLEGKFVAWLAKQK